MTLSISELQTALEKGRLSSENLVNYSLAAAERHKNLNAFITIAAQSAMRAAQTLDASDSAKGPLHGIPLCIKDNIHVAGMPNTGGTDAFRGFVPSQDAPLVKTLKAAGGIIIGKNNMHELGFGITNDNRAFGPARNFLNPEMIPGGSSGGTAAAVAAGACVAGIGSDTGGSVRIPAALNGLVGFRPTVGRYPGRASIDMISLSPTRGAPGPITRNLADAALLDSVLSGDDSGKLNKTPMSLEGVRLGVPRELFYDNLEPIVAEKMEALLAALRKAGAELIEANVENVADLNAKVGFPVVFFETKQEMPRYLNLHIPGETPASLIEKIKSPDVKGVMRSIFENPTPVGEYLQALNIYRPALQQAYSAYFSSHKVEAAIIPTMPLTARPIENSIETVELNGEQVPTFFTYIRNTDPSSNAGIPSLSLPLIPAEQEKVSLGVQLDGAKGSDRRLLAIGQAVEAVIRTIQ